MSFFKIARNAAADQYGRAHVDRYARRARVARWASAAGALVLAVLIVAAKQGSLGG